MKKGSAASWSDAGALTTAGTVAATIFCCLPFATGVVGAGQATRGKPSERHRFHRQPADKGSHTRALSPAARAARARGIGLPGTADLVGVRMGTVMSGLSR